MLTLSGNEITDALRALGVQGDGLLDDSSFGIWPAAINLCANGGFETNTTGWNAVSLARITTDSKFGAACAEIVFGPGNTEMYAVIAAVGNTAYTASCWAKAPVGSDARLRYDSDGGAGKVVGSTPLVADGAWHRVSFAANSGAGATISVIYIDSPGPVAATVHVDGVQLETGNVATPYIETDGGTATRAAARVQLPVAGLFTPTQGWVAFRMRMGFNTAAPPYTNPINFGWTDDGNNRFNIFYTAGGTFQLDRIAVGAGSGVAQAQAISVGDFVTVIARWTATNIYISVNGAGFTSAANANVPALAATLADLGGDPAIGNNGVADILWFACGSGVLTDADAAAIHAFGNTDPAVSQLPGAPTLVWPAIDAGTIAGQTISATATSVASLTTMSLMKVALQATAVGLAALLTGAIDNYWQFGLSVWQWATGNRQSDYWRYGEDPEEDDGYWIP